MQSATLKEVHSLKSMKSPPILVRSVLDAVLILMHKSVRSIEVVEGGGYRDSFAQATQVCMTLSTGQGSGRILRS